jgi:hypothetical protein
MWLFSVWKRRFEGDTYTYIISVCMPRRTWKAAAVGGAATLRGVWLLCHEALSNTEGGLAPLGAMAGLATCKM